MSDEKLEYLIDTYSNMIYRLSYSYLTNVADAQDVCQTVFMKLYSLNKEFKDIEHEKAFILRVTANVCKDILKSSWKKRFVDYDTVPEQVAPEIVGDDSILQSINELDEKYRTVIYLHYYEGYKVKEIAKILGINMATIKTRLSRGREYLKNILEED